MGTRQLNRLTTKAIAPDGSLDGLAYHERMEQVTERVLHALETAQRNGNPYVIFTHGASTSRRGAKTSRSQVRRFMRGPAATPFIDRKNCIQHPAVFLAAIRATLLR